MRFHFATIVAAATAALIMSVQTAAADSGIQVSGPNTHENLVVYFIHGPSAPGVVPLTLEEALEKGTVTVSETGDVNQLSIKNTGVEPVFIQSGEIVKGGRQDRTLTTSLVLPPHSGETPIAAFCVEHGRWSGRGSEDDTVFSSTTETVPSREAKLAMKAPLPVSAESAPNEQVYERQKSVWDIVEATKSRLSSASGVTVASPTSSTSLQLALENGKLQEMRIAYVKALEATGQTDHDIVGYAFAINGKLNSADVYSSNALFLKMWPKQLRAAAMEAIGEKENATAHSPSADAVKVFLDNARSGVAKDEVLNASNTLETREGGQAIYFATKAASGDWVHENYLAK